MALCVIGAVGCASAQLKGHPPVAFELWRGGDDSFTGQLGAAIEDALAKTQGFARTTEQRPGDLVVLIPTNVKWTRSGDRIHIVFDAAFTERQAALRERELGIAVNESHCWLDRLDDCTRLVVRGAVEAANKMRSSSVP
jgi:hypothetical protein